MMIIVMTMVTTLTTTTTTTSTTTATTTTVTISTRVTIIKTYIFPDHSLQNLWWLSQSTARQCLGCHHALQLLPTYHNHNRCILRPQKEVAERPRALRRENSPLTHCSEITTHIPYIVRAVWAQVAVGLVTKNLQGRNGWLPKAGPQQAVVIWTGRNPDTGLSITAAAGHSPG